MAKESPLVKHPLVIAHRGFSSQYPENTLESARAGISCGADLIEIDVQETLDGEVVVFHDFELQRLCGLPGSVSKASYSRIRHAKRDVPTLQQMLEEVRGKCPLLIEMKRVDPLKVARIIEQTKMVKQVIVFAFSIPLLEAIAETNPSIPRFGLIGDDLFKTIGELKKRVQVGGIGVANRLLRSKAIVQRVRREIGQVFVWTVNRESRMRELAEWGVDGIITNEPDRARKTFE